MKIQLDTTNKTIKLESDVQLQKLVNTLEKLLPKGEWKSFTLETNTVIERWSNPIIIRERPYYYPYREYPWVYCNTDLNKGESLSMKSVDTLSQVNADYKLNAGVFNVEV